MLESIAEADVLLVTKSRPPKGRTAEPRASSTVVLLRDTGQGPEVLLLRRNRALAFAGGMWVFPGGAVDAQDRQAADGDEFGAARIAAAREAVEECGLHPDPSQLLTWSHWTTPISEGRRFATWFFLAHLPDDGVVSIDGGEIHELVWLTPAEAVRRHEQGNLPMAPPTYLTALDLARFDSLDAIAANAAERRPPRVTPSVCEEEGQEVVVMYPGDAGYKSGDGESPGPRHRLVRQGRSWRYHCDPSIAEEHLLMPGPPDWRTQQRRQ